MTTCTALRQLLVTFERISSTYLGLLQQNVLGTSISLSFFFLQETIIVGF